MFYEVLEIGGIYRTKLIKRHHIETSQLICSADQLTGFYIMTALAFNELIKHPVKHGLFCEDC